MLGKQGHIAYPHLAHNPIHDSGKVIAALSEIEWDQGNEYFPPTSLQFSNVNSGTGASNVIPASAKLSFNLRFSTETTDAAIKHQVEQTLNDLSVKYEAKWTTFGQPFLTPQGRLTEAVTAAVNDELGIKPQLSTGGGTSDGRFIAPTGAQVVELGPVNASIHQINEHIDDAAPAQLASVYSRVLSELLLGATA